MKTYKVKNYKGNLVESLSKFQKSHKGMKIVEACEDGKDLKIKAEESKQQVEEDQIEKSELKPCPFCGDKNPRLMFYDDDYNKDPHGIKCSNKKCRAELGSNKFGESAESLIKRWNTRH